MAGRRESVSHVIHSWGKGVVQSGCHLPWKEINMLTGIFWQEIIWMRVGMFCGFSQSAKLATPNFGSCTGWKTGREHSICGSYYDKENMLPRPHQVILFSCRIWRMPSLPYSVGILKVTCSMLCRALKVTSDILNCTQKAARKLVQLSHGSGITWAYQEVSTANSTAAFWTSCAFQMIFKGSPV